MSTKLTLSEINKALEKKKLNDELRQSAQDKKDAIINHKTIKK